MGYTRQAIQGISWMTGFRGVSRVFALLKTIVIAHALTPSQFGLFGIATLVLGLLELLTETGINIFIIQSKKDINEYVNSAWVVSIIRGVLISFILFLSSPVIAWFFHAPQALSLLLFIAIIPFLRGFINPSEILFQKELQFKKEFYFRSLLFIVDATVAIILVVLTHSVYSLVWGMVVGVILEVILSFFIIKPLPQFRIERAYFHEIFHKGKWVTLFGIFNYFAQEGDTIIVGRVMGAGALGAYEMAYNISILPISEVADVVSKVVFPVFSKIANEKKRLFTGFFKTLSVIAVVSLCVGILIFLFPHEIVFLLLGNKWLSAVPALQVLAVYGVLRAVSGPASTLFLAVEKQQYVTAMTFARCIGLLFTIYPLVLQFGLVGAAYSALISVLCEIPVVLYYIWKIYKS